MSGLLFCVSAPLLADDISGIVTDAKTNEPLIGATIEVAETSVRTVSDADGKFHLTGLKHGKYNLTIKYVSYQPCTLNGFEAGADAYLAKPFNVDELRTVVERLLDRQRSLRNKFSDNATHTKEQQDEVQLTDTERRFLAKTVDHIYLLMDKQQLNVNTLAEKLCMSPRQFHRKIVTLTGSSPASFILNIKMKRARHLLETAPKMSIDDIAFCCGFEHTSSFYHAFRKKYGVTPRDVRRGIE